MELDLKKPIAYTGNRFIKANYVLYINGEPLYAGQSRDVLKRVAKHRSTLKNRSEFATGRVLEGFNWNCSDIVAKIFNEGACIQDRLELESLIHQECETLLSKP